MDSGEPDGERKGNGRGALQRGHAATCTSLTAGQRAPHQHHHGFPALADTGLQLRKDVAGTAHCGLQFPQRTLPVCRSHQRVEASVHATAFRRSRSAGKGTDGEEPLLPPSLGTGTGRSLVAAVQAVQPQPGTAQTASRHLEAGGTAVSQAGSLHQRCPRPALSRSLVQKLHHGQPLPCPA